LNINALLFNNPAQVFTMTDTQPSDTDACAATDGPPFRFMDLPAEIREMIYHHAMRQGMIVESTRRPFHFLLSVCSLIRKEASPIYFRVSRFALKLQPQPHTELTVLAFDRDTRNWFDLIGADRINDLRHVFFVFHNAKDQTHSARICVMDLWPFIDHHWRSPNNSLGALPAAYWITVSTEAQRASGITTIMAELVIVYSKVSPKCGPV
jgi:hypothetical protein